MNKWYRFQKPGVTHGFGHFAGDVANLDLTDEQERLMMTDGVIVPASADEIAKAEAQLHQDAQSPAATRSALAPPSADVQRQLDELFSRVATLEAQLEALLAAAPKSGKKE